MGKCHNVCHLRQAEFVRWEPTVQSVVSVLSNCLFSGLWKVITVRDRNVIELTSFPPVIGKCRVLLISKFISDLDYITFKIVFNFSMTPPVGLRFLREISASWHMKVTV